MNTSTNITQILRRGMTAALLTSAITATAVGLATTAHADDAPPPFAGTVQTGPHCKTEPFGLSFFGGQRRTLCDGPIAKDGSWSRERTIWQPAHYSTPMCTSRSNSSLSSCSGGYFIPERLVSNETYPVHPDTVLPDEPGHLD